MDRRDYRRVQLRLPARLRWTTPFGQKTEVCETLNVSRGGLLVPCREEHAAGTSLWVTFPYDPQLADPQPEIPARVIGRFPRQMSLFETVEQSHTLVPSIGLCFQPAHHSWTNGNGHKHLVEQRASPRRPLAIPLQIRPAHIPWFEEAMSMDVSGEGLRFLSNREYQPGQELLVLFHRSGASPWPVVGEVASQVVRVEPVAQSAAVAVCVARTH